MRFYLWLKDEDDYDNEEDEYDDDFLLHHPTIYWFWEILQKQRFPYIVKNSKKERLLKNWTLFIFRISSHNGIKTEFGILYLVFWNTI